MGKKSFEPEHPIGDVTEFLKNVAGMLAIKNARSYDAKLVSIEGSVEREPKKVEIDSFAYRFHPDNTPKDVRVLTYKAKVKTNEYNNKGKYVEVVHDVEPSLYVHGTAGVVGGWTWTTNDGRPADNYNVSDYVECFIPDYAPKISSIKIQDIKPKKKQKPKYSNQFVIIATAMHGDADKYEDVEISRRVPITDAERELANNEEIDYDVEEVDYSFGIKIDTETELKRALEVIGAMCNRPWNWLCDYLHTTRAYKEYLGDDWPNDLTGGDRPCMPTGFKVYWYDENGKKHPVSWELNGKEVNEMKNG